MGCDLLRSCYETDCRFSQGSTETVRICWYFCASGAKPLPFPTVFQSRNWDPEPGERPGLGELPHRKTDWRNGQNSPETEGKKPWGPSEVFLEGVSPGGVVNPDPPTFDALAACHTSVGVEFDFRIPGSCIWQGEGPLPPCLF